MEIVRVFCFGNPTFVFKNREFQRNWVSIYLFHNQVVFSSVIRCNSRVNRENIALLKAENSNIFKHKLVEFFALGNQHLILFLQPRIFTKFVNLPILSLLGLFGWPRKCGSRATTGKVLNTTHVSKNPTKLKTTGLLREHVTECVPAYAVFGANFPGIYKMSTMTFKL